MELPEIEAIARTVNARLCRKSIMGLRLAREGTLRGVSRKRLMDELGGQSLRRVERRGRYVVMSFEGVDALALYLASGSQVFFYADSKPPASLAMRLELGKSILAVQSQGESSYLLLVKQRNLDSLPGVGQSGLDPLGVDYSWPAFSLDLMKHKGRIKERLLSGSLVYGLGGIYCDEALFRARIHPGRKIERTSLDERKDLYHCIRDLTAEAVEAYGVLSMAPEDKESWKYPFPLYVYRRRNAPCLKCKTKIKGVKLGRQYAYYCSYCQK
jgi:formamidopyrimidine-DNA glycosylase